MSLFHNIIGVNHTNVLASKYKGYSFITVFGLAVGIACCLLIALYVRYEFSYDQYHERAEDVYRVLTQHSQNGPFSASSPYLLGEILEGGRITDRLTIKRSLHDSLCRRPY